MTIARRPVPHLRLLALLGVLLMGAARPESADAADLNVWAVSEGVRIDPLTGKAFEEDSKATPGGLSGDYKAKNLIWDGATKTISIKGAANEVLAFQIILEGQGAKNITVTAGDLRGPSGALITPEQFTFFRAFYIYIDQKVHYKRANFPLRAGWYAEPLVPLDTPKLGAPFAIDGSNFGGEKPDGVKNQTVWADLWIPKGTAKGTYKGNVTVASSAGKFRLNLAVEVFDFEMPDQNHTTYQLSSYNEFSRHSTKEWRNEFFIHAHQHRATITTSEAHRNLKPAMTHRDGKFDWEGFDKAYGPAIDGSLYRTGPRAGVPATHFNLQLGPRLRRPDKGTRLWGKAWPLANPVKNGGIEVDFTPDYVLGFTALLEDVAVHFSRKYPRTVLTVYQTGLDEVGFHKNDRKLAFAQLRSIQGYLKIFKAVGAKHKNVLYKLDMGSGFANCRYDLDGDGKKEGSRDVVDALGHGVGIWDINGSRINMKALAPIIRRGVPVWFYNGYEPRVGPTVTGSEGVGLRTWPWITWNSGLNGMEMWNFLEGYSNRPWKTGGVVKGGNKHAGFALFFYPGEDVGAPGEVFVSMRLKAIRRGMQDYEYFYLLAKKDGRKDRALAYAARVVRNTINVKLDVEDIIDDEVGEVAGPKLSKGDKRHWSHNPEDFERIRYRVGALLGR